jgi:hypothetical protein
LRQVKPEYTLWSQFFSKWALRGIFNLKSTLTNITHAVCTAHHTHTHLDLITLIIYGDDYYQSADKSLARPTSRCILLDGENISFDASLIIYIYK